MSRREKGHKPRYNRSHDDTNFRNQNSHARTDVLSRDNVHYSSKTEAVVWVFSATITRTFSKMMRGQVNEFRVFKKTENWACM